MKTPFITALRRVDVAEDLVVKVHTDDGHTGYGNAPATVVITGDSHESVAAAIRYTIGPNSSAGISTTAKISSTRSTNPWSTIRRPKPLWTWPSTTSSASATACPCFYRFFGGRKTRIASDLTISINDPAGMAADACQAVALGYSHLKLKVGIDPAIDFQRVAAIRQAVGPDITIRLDANQGWKPKKPSASSAAWKTPASTSNWSNNPWPPPTLKA